MANGRQKADRNVEAFASWIASMTNDDFRQVVFRGLLNRGEIAKGVNCAKSALRQNPRMAKMLADLEETLRYRGVLPDLTEQTKMNEDKLALHDPKNRKLTMDDRRVAKLEQENMALKAKNRALESQLKRFTELSDVLGKYGVIPR
jgi:hypothetical protein